MADFYKQHVEKALLQIPPDGDNSPLFAEEAKPATLLPCLRQVPKIDLHCHLNGSITLAMLAHMECLLLQEHRRTQRTDDNINSSSGFAEVESRTTEVDAGQTLFFKSQESTMRNVLASTSHSTPKDRMHYCFTVFDAIYKIMTNLAFTRLAVQDMLLCSAAEHIVMTEIRTSLRDGLTRTFRHTTDAAPARDVVSKAEYVNAVLETVEHLLSGGLVDFESGELLSKDVSIAIVENPRCSVDGEEGVGVKGVLADSVARWWTTYDRLYGSLYTNQPIPGVYNNSSGCVTAATVSEESSALPALHRLFFVRVVHANWTSRMHVRLLLSINRGAAEVAAWEAAHLTTSVQQRQIKDFHEWCCVWCETNRRNKENTGLSNTSPLEVVAQLRRTCWVTGIDLSGNCYKGQYSTFSPALEAARNGSARWYEKDESATTAKTTCTTAGVTIHGGEKQDPAELSAMIATGPERWGHLVFTDDDNLRRILAAHQVIELCLTSNLLTSGHANVAEHHLGHLLELWDIMPESRVCNVHEDILSAALKEPKVSTLTQMQRDKTRAAFVRRRYQKNFNDTTAGTAVDHLSAGGVQGAEKRPDSASCSYILPNISFHTDDRGVFGTTLSDELLLALQHPGVRQMCQRLTGESQITVATATKFFFWLERLSVPQLFDLPMQVQLLAVLMTEGKGETSPFEPNLQSQRTEAYERVRALLPDYSSALKHTAWQDWDTFERMCEDVRGNPKYEELPCWLSKWECSWLYELFDTYWVHTLQEIIH